MGLLFMAVAFSAAGQKIVVDSTSTNKYLIRPPKKEGEQPQKQEELTFSDRALSIGKGILNRLKARLNLEEAAGSIKDKKDKILGRDQEDQDAKKEEDG